MFNLGILFPVSVIIFATTLVLVLKRPRNIGIGYVAMAGALVSLALGTIDLESVLVVWSIVWNATFTFIAIILISLLFDEAGIFRYTALKIARFARGNGITLFLLIILLGSGISAIFANDGTALILTPIVYEILVNLKFPKKQVIPFIMATGFIADSASLPLPVSNLVNIVSTTYFGISFNSYAGEMIIPDLVSIASSLFILWLFYRKSIPLKYHLDNLEDPEKAIREPYIFRIAIPTVIILIAAYSIGGYYDVPIAFVSMSAAVIVMLFSYYRSNIDIKKVLSEAPWQIVLFSFGMYLVVFGMGREGFTYLISYLLIHISMLSDPIKIILSGYLFSFMASGMNNMPSVMLGALSISSIHGGSSLIYANVIGNDIGPKFTPIGSLATLLWLYTLNKKKGITISYSYYMKVGFAIALPVLTMTLLSLWLESFL